MFIAFLNYRNKAAFPKEMIDAGGVQYTVKEYDVDGIAKACNSAILGFIETQEKYLTIIANDILEPPGWAKERLNYMESNPDVGICSISINRLRSLHSQDIIGNFTIRRELISKIGLFNEEFDPYGPIDLDYCHRAQAAGFKTCYIPGLIAHTGVHGSGNEYGYDKHKLVEQSWGKLIRDLALFDKGEGIFINKTNGYTIDFNEWPEK